MFIKILKKKPYIKQWLRDLSKTHKKCKWPLTYENILKLTHNNRSPNQNYTEVPLPTPPIRLVKSQKFANSLQARLEGK